ncbi:WXG100 family type VII secretion target [Streptomyces sp. NPDC097107]|uniref:WXG100 family type VII secretion target n=1 Tax=unclassified Streptomyces TaxID=2593676 RepID=UPI001B37BB83|nr:WXG100 family type VII secretion target [Streptomyces sp. b94]MBQ1094987.1 WXG100 family type VII secretion target [Streptomyces sp. b94]
MAKDLDITYQDMRDAAKHVVKEKEKLQEKLDGLRKYIANLVESGYVTKSSSKAFDENFDEFTKGAKTTLDGLDGMGDYLTTAADKFEQIDEELAKQARSK